jgi:hypothetical protein
MHSASSFVLFKITLNVPSLSLISSLHNDLNLHRRSVIQKEPLTKGKIQEMLDGLFRFGLYCHDNCYSVIQWRTKGEVNDEEFAGLLTEWYSSFALVT